MYFCRQKNGMERNTKILNTREFMESETEVEVRHYNHQQDYETNDIMIKHWESETSLSRENLTECPCCGNKVIGNEENYWVGAHVVTKDQERYITPTCNKCNSTYKERKAKEKWFFVKRRHLCQLPR